MIGWGIVCIFGFLGICFYILSKDSLWILKLKDLKPKHPDEKGE